MKNSQDAQETLAMMGCIVIVASIFLIPLLIKLLEVLIIIASIGGIGFLIFKVVQYDKRTGNLTYTIEKNLKLPISDLTRLELPQTNETKLLELMSSEKEKEAMEVQKIKLEIEEIKQNQESDIIQAISKYADKIEVQKKKEAIQSIFTDLPKEEYRESDTFEQRQHHEKIKKQKEELDIRGLKQEMAEELFEQKKTLLEHKYETKDEFMNVRREMIEGFLQVQENLRLLAQDMMTFKTYVSEKFNALEIAFFKELNSLREMVIQIHTEFKLETSEMKLSFGKEILRVDKQQMSLADKMRTYESQVRNFGIEIKRIKMDAEKFSMRGQEMLAKAQLAQQQHQLQTRELSKDIAMSLEKIALKEQGFANTVGAAKIKMDEISNQQYLALKDMAFERIGINALRDDYQQRVSLEHERFNRLNDQHRNLLQQIKTAQSHGKEVAGLEHRMNMTREDLNYSQNQLGLYRHEMSQIKRLSK